MPEDLPRWAERNRELPCGSPLMQSMAEAGLPHGPAHPAWHPPEPSAPADSPLPPAADKRLAPLIVLLFEIVVVVEVVVIVVVVDNKCRACHGARVFTLYVVILPLKKSRHIAGACVVYLSTVLVFFYL